jgi:rRNA-processing protein FCF1
MVDYPSRCVIDTNALIDLYIGDLLPTFFSLGWEILAPDVIVAELNSEPSSSTLLGYGLRVMSFSEIQVREMETLRQRYRRPSVPDLFALLLARREGVLLLTGDRHLRQAADQEGVPVRGTLWVLDTLVEQRRVAPADAARSLQRMIDRGTRLPTQACDLRLQQWTRP